MRLRRTTTALAALLMAGSLGACADYTTTGVPSEEEATEESISDTMRKEREQFIHVAKEFNEEQLALKLA